MRIRCIERLLRESPLHPVSVATDQGQTLDSYHAQRVVHTAPVTLGEAVRLDRIAQDRVGNAAEVGLGNRNGLGRVAGWDSVQCPVSVGLFARASKPGHWRLPADMAWRTADIRHSQD